MLCAQSRWCVAAAAAAATRAAVLAMPPPDHRNTAIDHRTPPYLVLCSDPGARLAAGSARRSRSAPGARAPLQCGGLQRCGSGVQRAAALRRAAVGVCSNQAPPTHLPHTPPWLGAGVRCGPLSGPRPSGATPPFTCFQRGRRASARSRCDADKQPRPTIAPHAAPTVLDSHAAARCAGWQSCSAAAAPPPHFAASAATDASQDRERPHRRSPSPDREGRCAGPRPPPPRARPPQLPAAAAAHPPAPPAALQRNEMSQGVDRELAELEALMQVRCEASRGRVPLSLPCRCLTALALHRPCRRTSWWPRSRRPRSWRPR